MGALLHLLVRTLQSGWQTSGTEKMVLTHFLLLSLSTMTNSEVMQEAAEETPVCADKAVCLGLRAEEQNRRGETVPPSHTPLTRAVFRPHTRRPHSVRQWYEIMGSPVSCVEQETSQQHHNVRTGFFKCSV